MSTSKLVRITPIFQALLNREIGKAMDAIDDGNLVLAYTALQTLIDSLKERDSNPLLEHDIAEIDQLLEEASKRGRTNFYMGLLNSSKRKNQVYSKTIRLLYRKVLRVLHKGNYLEIIRNVPRYYEQGIKPGQIE